MHDPSNENCPLNDPETHCNPATAGLPCDCEPAPVDAFSKHEVYDRASVVNALWYDSVREHPVVEADPELASLADRASDAMVEFYVRAASKLGIER